MKKILFITPNISSGGGGAERQLVNTAVMLKEKGHDVEVVSYAEGEFYAHMLIDNNIKIHRKFEKTYLKRLFAIRKLIRNGNYDAVFSFLGTPNFINNFSAIGGKSWKVITGERSAKESDFHTKRGKIFAWMQRYADNIVCNSENARNMWLKYYPKYEYKLATIYNTINIPEISSIYKPKYNDKLNIVIAASYRKLKNPIGLINALILMSEDERENINIKWYGKNDHGGDKMFYEQLNKMIIDNNLEKSLSLNPATNDIFNIVNKTDFVALLSSVEGLPNTICEGMMLGKPIIMSRVSDYNVLVDKNNGFLCDWDNYESIREALLLASELSENKMNDMGLQSKYKAHKLFTEESNISKWESLIK